MYNTGINRIIVSGSIFHLILYLRPFCLGQVSGVALNGVSGQMKMAKAELEKKLEIKGQLSTHLLTTAIQRIQ